MDRRLLGTDLGRIHLSKSKLRLLNANYYCSNGSINALK